MRALLKVKQLGTGRPDSRAPAFVPAARPAARASSVDAVHSQYATDGDTAMRDDAAAITGAKRLQPSPLPSKQASTAASPAKGAAGTSRGAQQQPTVARDADRGRARKSLFPSQAR